MSLDEFWVNSYVNTVGGTPAMSNVVLQSGVQYRVRIDGNWTAWADANHQNELWQYFTYGAGDFVPIKYHSPGRNLRHSQFNAEWFYASHENVGIPAHDHTGVQWDTGAAGWVHNVEPVGGIGAAWNATNHIYDYIITGAGQKLRMRVGDSNRFDNDGMLKVTINPGGWVVGAIAAG